MEQRDLILSADSFEVSYSHYINRVYGTKAGPYRIEIRVVVVMLLLCYVCNLRARMVYRDLFEIGVPRDRVMLC